MNLIPNENYIIVKPDQAETKTESGIFLPSQSHKSIEGTVVSVGNNQGLTYTEGWKVIYRQYIGTEYEVDGEKLLILNKAEVIAFYKN